jgi:alpha-L-fucosidase
VLFFTIFDFCCEFIQDFYNNKQKPDMKNVFLIFICLLTLNISSQNTIPADKKMAWWREARFGMFIHWGVYAIPGGIYNGHEMRRGGGEWIMNRMKIPVPRYQEYAKQFNPVNYDPDEWVKLAKEAGMKYIVITSKHHDGFALFKSAASQWNVADATPWGKDLLEPLAKACRRHGIKLGFYYSQAQDWNNPGGAAARKATTEGWLNPDSARIDAYTKANNGHWDHAQMTRTMDQYIDEVAVPQVRELLTNYGKISVFWWDTPTNMTAENADKLQNLLKLQPGIITNDRLKRPDFTGDYKTPEQKIPNLSELDGKDWETCMTMNGTWGYKSYDHNWKSSVSLIRNLIDIASKGGNYLLNVGPKADGSFPDESIERLKSIGEWMKINKESVYGTSAGDFPDIKWGRCTKKESRNSTTYYFHVFEWPANGELIVPGFNRNITSTRLLANKRTIEARTTDKGLIFKLPELPVDNAATVIELKCSKQS